MLLDIREKSQSWIAWVIVILISVPFALWGINSYFTGGSEVIVAKVNERDISLRAYQQAAQEHRQRLQTLLGANYRSKLMESPEIKRAVLDNMVENELVNQYLSDAGYSTSDKKLINQLKNISEFQTNGKFDKSLYSKTLGLQGMSQSQFEANMRHSLTNEQFRSSFNLAAVVFPYEIKNLAQLEGQKRVARILNLPTSLVTINDVISEDEAKQEFTSNKERYYISEAVKVDYVELKLDDISQGIEVDEKTLQDLYEQNKETLKTAEKRRYSHIMLAVKSDADKAATLDKIKNLKQEIDLGADFAALAREHSADPGSAKLGGDMGYFLQESVDAGLAEEVFKLTVGEVSAPIKSVYGYHLILLTDIKAPSIKPYSEARAEILLEEKKRRSHDIFFEKHDVLANLAYEHPDSLDDIVANLKLKQQKSGWIERGMIADNIFANAKVQQAIFSARVLKEATNSEVISLSEEHVVVLRLNEHRPKRYKKIEEVKDELAKAITAQRTKTALDAKAQEIITQLRTAGKSMEEVAGVFNLSWTDKKEYLRNRNDALSNKLFRMKQHNLPTYDSLPSTIIALLEVIIPPVTPEQEELYRKQLADQLAYQNYEGFIQHLRATSDVKTYQEHIVDNNR